MSALSPGLAQSSIELLHLVQRQSLSPEELLKGLSRIGGMPVADALSLSQTLNWIQLATTGEIQVSEQGHRVCSGANYAEALRVVILDYASIVRPDWLQNAPSGRARVLSYSPPGISQVLVEAEVGSGTTDDVVAFWDGLASLARGQHNDRMLAIGREGERLTLNHEEARTGRVPRWVAIDSNRDGYDILSIVGPGDNSPLSIEVKTSSIGLSGVVHLTRNEWDLAQDSTTHAFYLWDLSDRKRPRLAVVSIERMAPHIPLNSGDGSWLEVGINFKSFDDLFSVV
jgi:hypothetical protein